MVPYYKILVILLLPFFSVAQNSDWKELQGKIDDAVKTGGIVRVERNYKIDRPLIAHNWDGTRYGQAYLQIIGNATMWDRGQNSVIEATFSDAPVLSIQVGKGVIIRGLHIIGKKGRNSQYSPQAALCIDPFSAYPPIDGGYPSLRDWYRGPLTRAGSTGVRVEDCTFANSIAGVITSPNGYTQNADMLTFENIRFIDCQYGFVGCQAQEKLNRVINVGCWTKMDCLFMFNRYGAKQPGHWILDGANIAGGVDSIIHRYSIGWGPMMMKNVFAESVQSIGIWYAGSGDIMSECVINLRYPEQTGYYPDYTLSARYLNIQNSNIRYYGRPVPMLFYWAGEFEKNTQYLPPILNAYGHTPHKGLKVKQPFRYSTDTVSNHTATVYLNYGANVTPGAHILFMQMNDWSFKGQGQVASVSGDTVQLRYISPAIKDLSNYRIGVYEKN